MIQTDSFIELTNQFNQLISNVELLQKWTFQNNKITAEQYNVLDLIQRYSNCTVSKLSEVKGVKKSSVTVLVNRLQEKGLLEKVKNERDNRSSFLILTTEGQGALKDSQAKFIQLLSDSLGERFQIDTFLTVLEKLNCSFKIEGDTEHEEL